MLVNAYENMASLKKLLREHIVGEDFFWDILHEA